MPEEFRQITSSKKIWELRFELLLIIWRVGNTYPRMRQDLEIHGQMWHIIPNYLRFEIWFLKSMISFYSIFSLYIQECTLSLTIWELRFEFLVCDSFPLSIFQMFWWIGDFGSKENLRIEIWDLSSCRGCGQFLSLHEKCRYLKSMVQWNKSYLYLFENWDLSSWLMISCYSIFSLCIEEYMLSLRIWELKFEILVSDTLLLNLFHMFCSIGVFGS